MAHIQPSVFFLTAHTPCVNIKRRSLYTANTKCSGIGSSLPCLTTNLRSYKSSGSNYDQACECTVNGNTVRLYGVQYGFRTILHRTTAQLRYGHNFGEKTVPNPIFREKYGAKPFWGSHSQKIGPIGPSKALTPPPGPPTALLRRINKYFRNCAGPDWCCLSR